MRTCRRCWMSWSGVEKLTCRRCEAWACVQAAGLVPPAGAGYGRWRHGFGALRVWPCLRYRLGLPACALPWLFVLQVRPLENGLRHYNERGCNHSKEGRGGSGGMRRRGVCMRRAGPCRLLHALAPIPWPAMLLAYACLPHSPACQRHAPMPACRTRATGSLGQAHGEGAVLRTRAVL